MPSVYFLEADTSGDPLFKIGYTSGDPADRIAALQTGCPYSLSLFGTAEFESEREARAAESALHQRLARWRLQGEWFSLPAAVVRSVIAEGGIVPDPPADDFRTVRFAIVHQHYVWIERERLPNGRETGLYFYVTERFSGGDITTGTGVNVQDALANATRSVSAWAA